MKGAESMSFLYSLSHIDFDRLKTKRDALTLLEKHHYESFEFCENTAQLNIAIGKELGLSDDELYILFQCGIFHDIGKLGMPVELIDYPGAFTIQMYKEMKKHTIGGRDILMHIKAEKEIVQTAHYHHNNYDGSGYPGGLYEDEIPLFARITRISDSSDAYMSKRCYKENGPINGLLKDIEGFKNTSYDPGLVDILAIVHHKIMHASHVDGTDRPSQSLYMFYLAQMYGEDIMGRFFEENQLLKNKKA
jgi:putative nucleotidyltransferase with HDIG domain